MPAATPQPLPPCSIFSKKTQMLLSDNGSEFKAGFAKTLEQHGIPRGYTYPNSPQMKAHLERGKSAVLESFADYHEDPLLTNHPAFNQKLAD